MYSCGPPLMDVQEWDDQHELTYSSYVRTRVLILKTCRRRWMIGRNGERRSGISAQAARHDDDDMCVCVYVCVCLCVLELTVKSANRQAELKFAPENSQVLFRNNSTSMSLKYTLNRRFTYISSMEFNSSSYIYIYIYYTCVCVCVCMSKFSSVKYLDILTSEGALCLTRQILVNTCIRTSLKMILLKEMWIFFSLNVFTKW